MRQVLALARRFGREGDVRVLNFVVASGLKDSNAFAAGNAGAIRQLPASQLGDTAQNDSQGLFGELAVALIGTIALVLVWLRNHKGVPLNIDVIRFSAEVMVLAAAGRGVRASVVQLSPWVHCAGDHGLVPALIAIERRTGIAAFVGTVRTAGRRCTDWTPHACSGRHSRRRRPAPGARLHGLAEEAIPMRAIAETIGAGLGVPVRSLTEDEARTHFDWMASFVAIDNPISSAQTRASLGWPPGEAGATYRHERGRVFLMT